jgi:hypothetical protein
MPLLLLPAVSVVSIPSPQVRIVRIDEAAEGIVR